MTSPPTPVADTLADSARPPSALPAAGERVGRYLILGRLGAGGMGVVFEARDTVLARRVALKFLHRTSEVDAHKRLLREAQALARLAHPNVVAVLDVGRHGDGVFLAMELVAGRTLADWLRDAPRGWAEIVDVFVDAARGLAAAHEAGLVHRDFKPHNVMVGDDGRVRVMDFGLARTPGATVSSDAEITGEGDLLGADITRGGTIVGTPTYMAPEQHTGEDADARADQFSLCVALFEALYGKAPFAGATPMQIAAEKLEGRVREPSGTARVPGWLLPIVVRGLAPRPEQRHPSLAALVAAISSRRRRGRRRLLAIAAAIGGAATLGLAFTAAEPSARCRGAQAKLAGVWSPARATTIADAMRDTGVVYAESAWQRARPGVERWLESWSAAHQRACEATGADDGAALDARMACLDERLHELHALLGAFERPSERMVAGLAHSVDALSDPAACEQAGSNAPIVEDAGAAGRLAEARRRLAEAKGLIAAGRYDDAVVALESLRTTAEAASIAAELDLAEGRAHTLLGESDAAVAAYERAYFAAAADGSESIAVDAALGLVDEVGFRFGQIEAALRWAEHARARLHADDARMVRLEGCLGNAWLGARRPDRAAGHFRAALEIGEAAGELGSLVHVGALGNLAIALAQSGETEEALPLFERCEVEMEELLGPKHPDVARAITNTAAALVALGRLDEGAARVERALEIDREVGAPGVQRAQSFNMLGLIRTDQVRLDEAVAAFEEGLDVLGNGEGGTADRITLSMNLATALHRLGRLAEAGEKIDRAIALELDLVGPSEPGHATTLMVRAHIRLDAGDVRAALGDAERALASTGDSRVRDDAMRLVADAKARLGPSE